MIKIRCSNFGEGNKYWLEVKKRVCSLCELKEGTIKHLVKECKEIELWKTGLPSHVKENWEKVFDEGTG